MSELDNYHNLFTFKGWDQMDTMSICYYEAELLVPMGEHPVGSKFSSIILDFDMGTCQLHLDGETRQENGHEVTASVDAGKYSLNISVGEKLES